MSDALSFAEIDGQRVELLPARTVLSMFSTGGSCGGCTSTPATSTPATGTPATGQGITGGPGGKGVGEAAFWAFTYVENGNVTNEAIGGAGGAGGAASGAPAAGGGGATGG